MKSKIHEYQNKFFTMSKTKIKILVMTVALTLFMSGNATAQGMPTYDNTNFISLVKQLIESGKQTAQMIKSVKFLKDAKEAIEKVSSVVEQLRAVEEIGQNNQRLINVMQNDLQDILNSPYIKPDEVSRVVESFDAIVQNSLDTVDFIDEVLSSDYLKMSDAERAEILKAKEQESKQMVSNITTKTKRYRDIISFRKMQDKVNNRETSY
ncbi:MULTISPECIES: conjugal transfer protein [Maribacter]|uniref:Conjugal transfer protein n=2 Tax=Flavobacteriaceae TaxID=49546 RepID=A0ABU7ID01_9FLAO|nr:MULTISPECIES: conjugal transfer protein [Maribacter]MDC6403678.1 conjugal transfer protein [Maribacter sp. PR66]MEE1970819.1 conjugal transfer protein [Maribacter flavus]NNK18045.1 conjugal transfer protein [Maribacter sp.]|tara:strand:+ start:1665 stop:2291 length:627 start_codon:yes stop_codon:yes gene_type:complete